MRRHVLRNHTTHTNLTRFIVILPICSNISVYWQFAVLMKSGKSCCLQFAQSKHSYFILISGRFFTQRFSIRNQHIYCSYLPSMLLIFDCWLVRKSVQFYLPFLLFMKSWFDSTENGVTYTLCGNQLENMLIVWTLANPIN